MIEKNKIKKASTFYLIGNLFNKGIVFLTVPIFTRILSVSDYGIVSTYNSWVSILTIVISLALYMAVRSSFIDYEKTVNDFLAVVLTFTCIFGTTIAALILAFVFVFSLNFNAGIVALCLIQSISAALIEDVSMYLMMKYNYKTRTLLMVLPNLLSTVVAIVVIKFCLKSNLFLGRIVPNAVITFIFGMLVLVFELRKSKVRFNKEYLSYGLKIAVPLVVHGLALSFLSQSDRTMITMIRNSSETGIYALIYNFSMIATVITTSFEGVWAPFFIQNMKNENYGNINKYAKKYIEFMTVAMICVILFGPEVVKILASKPYWEGISIIPPIVLANYMIFLYTFYVNVEHYHKKTVFISINTAFAAIINIALNLYFIRKWGYIGAAYTTLISYIISLFLHYVYARRLNNQIYSLKNVLIPSFILVISVIVFYIFDNIWMVRWIIAFLCLAFLAFKERKVIISTLKS